MRLLVPAAGTDSTSPNGAPMIGGTPTREETVASKDKGGKSEKKQPQKNLKEKRAAKKQKKAK